MASSESSSSSASEDFELIDHEEASLEPEALAQTQAWLQPTDYMAESGEFNRHLSSHAPGTGLWICDTPRFHQWYDSEGHGSLWIKGVPGAGKSVIAASMVEHLKNIDNAPVLFFFFRYIISANRRPRSLVRDWLAQLLPYSLRLQATLQTLIGGELDDMSDEQLWEYLLIGLSSVQKAYCIVDALDEMELLPNDGFLRRLNNLATFRPQSVKLLMTSRPKQFLQSSLRDASIVHISLEQDLVGKDIAVFVLHRLGAVIKADDEEVLRESLASTICTRSRGLFLYARLLLDQIVPTLQLTQTLDVDKLANSLPIGLEEMYNSMLFQQAESLNIETCIQVFLLECVTHSARTLRLNELASVLPCAFSPSEIPDIPKAIARSACTPLLEILEDETVQVIHHSFTEFLIDAERITKCSQDIKRQFPVLNSNDVHRKLMMICLTYLQSGALRPNKKARGKAAGGSNWSECAKCGEWHCECSEDEEWCFDYQQARLQYTFLEYAADYWAYHASYYDVEDVDFFHIINTFLDTNSVDFRTWLSISWNSKSTKRFPVGDQKPSALHIAAYTGLSKYALTILHEGQYIEALDAEGRTPLHWACRRNHPKIVALLLQNGANPDPEDGRGIKPIHEAAKKNYAAIVKMLLEAGVDPLSPKTRENFSKGRILGGEVSTKGETAIMYVSRHGHTETLVVMLPYLQPDTLEKVLCESCQYGKSENVRAVLQNSTVSPDSKFCGASALFLACKAQNVICIEALLAREADANLMSEWAPERIMGHHRKEKPTAPLHCLLRYWREENHHACYAIFRMLLKAGADLELKDGNGNTPLHYCNEVATKYLLEAGASIYAVDSNGDTVLHRYLKGHRDIGLLEMLFDYGVNINERGEGGNTALHTALSARDSRGDPPSGPNSLDELIGFLLKKEASCNAKNDDGGSVIPLAIRNRDCSLQTFKILLQFCSDETARNRCLFNVGVRGTSEVQVQFIQALMAAGVSLESHNKDGKPALLFYYRSEDTVKALLECGARLDAVDSNGWGMLHYFVSSVDRKICMEKLEDLVKAGLDPLQLDKKGNSILHCAVLKYSGTEFDVQFIEQILNYGIPVNVRNHAGLTPFHSYIDWGCVPQYDRKSTLVPLNTLFREKGGADFDINAQDEEGLTPLHLAAMRSVICVVRLLAAGADPSILTKNGRSVLHLACRARKSEIVGFLLQETGNQLLDKADSFARTPLHDACTSGRPESVYYLLKAGAKINAKDSRKRTPLHSCAEFAAEQNIWLLSEHKNKEAGHYTPDRYRPGAWRRIPSGKQWYQGSYEHSMIPPFSEHDTARVGGIVKSLLAAGADIAATDELDLTPLDLALKYGCQQMVKALQFNIREMPELWQTNPDNARLLTLVALNQKPPISALPLSDVTRQEILHNPYRYLSMLDHDDIDWITSNSRNITDIEDDFSGRSLLYPVAERGLTEMMKRLGYLARIFDDPEPIRIHIRNSEKFKYSFPGGFRPPLQIACKRELPNLEMLEILIDNCGVDINAHSLVGAGNYGYGGLREILDGPTALHVLAEAKFWWQLDGIRLLVKKGANINSRNERGETPLHVACSGKLSVKNSLEKPSLWRDNCVHLLLSQGADPNVLDDAGLSPLHKAGSAPEVMQILLQGGAKLCAGKISPLFSAIQARDVEALRILLDMGADPNSIDTMRSCQVSYRVTDQERCALFCASFAQSFQNVGPIVKLLIERGADMYLPLNDQETLIHYVFQHAEYDVINAFLECAHKIDFDDKDQLGRTVFLAACDWSGVFPVDPKVPTPIIRLLDLGVDITAVDSEGRNALHHLLDNLGIKQDVILQFLSRPACKPLLSQKDNKDFTPLHYALRLLRPQACEALINLGCDTLAPDPNGATALHHIASQALQIYHRSSSNSYSSHDLPASFFTDCVRLWTTYVSLGLAGPDAINARDGNGDPPLFAYLSSPQRDYRWNDPDKDKNCHVENFPLFFGRGDGNGDGGRDTDVFARNKEGETALHIIAKRADAVRSNMGHNAELFEFFMMKLGLDPLAEDERGRSALDVAAACGSEKILQLFGRD